MITRFLHSCSYMYIIEFINFVFENDKILGKASHVSFSTSCVITSIIHEHSCKIHYLDFVDMLVGEVNIDPRLSLL